jgi:Uma2 family endonuclease
MVGGMPLEAWMQAPASVLEFVEVVAGEPVVKRVGGNPHHYLARRLAEEFERQWPNVTAVAPGHWALQMTEAGRVQLGRVPDVLVDGDSLLADPVFLGVPDLVVEVWSPSNTLGEMNDKRREYRDAGLPVLVEASITDSGEVRLEWLGRGPGRWATVAVAAGEDLLEVSEPQPFQLVPNSLLRRRA